jgi:hypothetical protein
MLAELSAIGQERKFKPPEENKMSKMKSALGAVLKRELWVFVSVMTMNAGLQYSRDGQVSAINWVAVLLGTLLVTVVALPGEMYWMSKSN